MLAARGAGASGNSADCVLDVEVVAVDGAEVVVLVLDFFAVDFPAVFVDVAFVFRCDGNTVVLDDVGASTVPDCGAGAAGDFGAAGAGFPVIACARSRPAACA